MLYRDFHVTWESPTFGLFQGTAFSTAPWIHRFCFRAVNTPKENAMTKNHPKPVPVLAVPKLSEGQLEPLFRRLNLAHTRGTYQESVDRPAKQNSSYPDFLTLLLAQQ